MKCPTLLSSMCVTQCHQILLFPSVRDRYVRATYELETIPSPRGNSSNIHNSELERDLLLCKLFFGCSDSSDLHFQCKPAAPCSPATADRLGRRRVKIDQYNCIVRNNR